MGGRDELFCSSRAISQSSDAYTAILLFVVFSPLIVMRRLYSDVLRRERVYDQYRNAVQCVPGEFDGGSNRSNESHAKSPVAVSLTDQGAPAQI
jgi:hypothetical protein